MTTTGADTAWRADVAVVGAGPAGSATAALLARAGHDVLLLDRAHFPRAKPCAEYLSPGAVALLRHLGVLDRLPASTGRVLRGMELHGTRGGRFLLQYADAHGPRAGLSIAREHLDLALLEHARRASARVHEGFRVAAALRTSGVVHGVHGTDANGRRVEIRARLVVGADGLHSVVVRELDLRRPVVWPRRLGLVAHLRGMPWPEDHGQLHVGRHGYVGVAPLGGSSDLVSVGLVRPLPRGRLGPPAAALWAGLREYPALARRLAGAALAGPVQGVGPLAHRLRPGPRAGAGYLLVGDAAGFLDPFTGEGIYRALRGAQLAAGVADRALRISAHGVVRPGPDYERMRCATFGAKERLTALVQLFVQFPRLMDYAIERFTRRPALAAQLSNVLGDVDPAILALEPRFLWALLRP